MSGTPLPPADVYITIQPSGGPFKADSIKEGFVCSGIWAILSTAIVAGIRLWTEHAHPEQGILSAEEWGHFIGAAVGQFLLIAVVLSSVVFYRRRKNVTSFILLDWRWWLVCVIFGALPNKPVLAWLWVGLIYQVRLSFNPKPKFPSSPTTAV
jgi:hypothetical protein